MAKFADWAYGRPGSTALLNAGFTGVLRYLSYVPQKNIGSTEYTDYVAAGLRVHLVWENGAAGAKQGYSVGFADGVSALIQARAIIGSKTAIVPVYFAVDFDATDADMPAIYEYFRGVLASFPPDYVGVYGSAKVVTAVAGRWGLRYRWQTIAWSAHVLARQVNLFQTGQQQTVNGVVVDVNQVYLQETGAINMGYADDQIRGVTDAIPGVNPSDFAHSYPVLVQAARDGVNAGLNAKAAVNVRADSLAAQLDEVQADLTALRNTPPVTIDYNALAQAILRAVLAPKQ